MAGGGVGVGAERRGGERRAAVLVFAGVDPSGGAGVAADLQAIAAQGAHALTVVTALTAQDNDRVHAVEPVAPALLLRQAEVLIDKIAIAAVKIGIPGSAANARVIAGLIERLRQLQPQLPVVLDPVLASGHGDLLSRDDAALALAPLLPLVTLLTPNGPEARALTGQDTPAAQAAALRARGCRHVLVTGGHDDDSGVVVNRWYGAGREQHWRWQRLAGGFHGSGCTLASACAGLLAQGLTMERALQRAQQYCHHTLADSYAIADGQRVPRR
ncbi:hydroxymethylpyrimidine/phosphomethylpyrimidine kinase [Rugamonas sp. CCM 8940]|uniref:bifunctional hydroxymethylpyrimidine kinase/phosphomethylpyrimidine kinase n=1 Tax=Rugamonas sp. CCM 8940 TaxID=2765359 RepID=UPI0018F501E0|nr:hydroxymethylpyrimidine/phosphomethylpyrimidine kinase [Rugamonas sp. CCM 8940]MBJ7314146.1 hydroxymethylpyrimidine/phosphomethylpyrimidine kinase [Rugamonas sp. CCM 8940]